MENWLLLLTEIAVRIICNICKIAQCENTGQSLILLGHGDGPVGKSAFWTSPKASVLSLKFTVEGKNKLSPNVSPPTFLHTQFQYNLNMRGLITLCNQGNNTSFNSTLKRVL